MDYKHHTHPDQLERYSFWWSEARLVIAAIALFLGGVPPLVAIVPLPYGLSQTILTLSWLIAGAASLYMLYRWYSNGQRLFGRKVGLDMFAFFVSVVSGLNLGLTAIIRTNPGMQITQNRLVFVIVGLVYLATAWYLYQRWEKNNKRIF